jgi:hypothetical protein
MEAVDTCQRRILYLDSYSRSALKLRVALVCRLPRVRAISARARSGVVCVPVWRDCARLQLRLLACGFVSASASVQYSASVHYWMRVSRPAGSTRFRPWVCVCTCVCVCAGAICAVEVCGIVCTRACRGRVCVPSHSMRYMRVPTSARVHSSMRASHALGAQAIKKHGRVAGTKGCARYGETNLSSVERAGEMCATRCS